MGSFLNGSSFPVLSAIGLVFAMTQNRVEKKVTEEKRRTLLHGSIWCSGPCHQRPATSTRVQAPATTEQTAGARVGGPSQPPGRGAFPYHGVALIFMCTANHCPPTLDAITLSQVFRSFSTRAAKLQILRKDPG